MLPVVAIVGRPNVGKSTLFNRLTRSRDALVADLPGLTRDRQYGTGRLGSSRYLVIDTGGLSGNQQGLEGLMAEQVWQAIEEADRVLLLTDARQGLTAADEEIGDQLRRAGKQVYLVANKAEGLSGDVAGAEFYSMGMGEPRVISATHGQGVVPLIEAVLADFPPPSESEELETDVGCIRVAVLGRPNVGKSTLVNRFAGQDRVLTFDQPGTTRDSIVVPFERDGIRYQLIDTAGVRRRSRVAETIEKFSVIKALQALEKVQVAILVMDATEGIGDQDATLAGHVLESGRALVLAVNKWDGLSAEQRVTTKRQLDIKMPFLDYAEKHFISALHGTGVGNLLASVQRAQASTIAKFTTPRLTKILEAAVQAHQPPLMRGRRIKLRYAHQGGRNPPVIVVHGNQTERVPETYRRYLANRFRKELHLVGTPVRLEFKTGTNPFKGRRNVLTPSQQRKRKRLLRHVKR
ncbi:MAG: ribosome biogenesis GTPase Der [Gammaproteobacteria bacterium]